MSVKLTKHDLIRVVQKADKFKLVIAQSSPTDTQESIITAELNDFVLHDNGVLELWHNTGYEI